MTLCPSLIMRFSPCLRCFFLNIPNHVTDFLPINLKSDNVPPAVYFKYQFFSFLLSLSKLFWDVLPPLCHSNSQWVSFSSNGEVSRFKHLQMRFASHCIMLLYSHLTQHPYFEGIRFVYFVHRVGWILLLHKQSFTRWADIYIRL